jgi:prevent-host-death family protein
MVRISVTELKNQLSKYLRLVKQGETVEVLERSIPIARLEGLSRPAETEPTVRDRLIADGIVVAARVQPRPGDMDAPPIACAADAVKALREEREGR